MVTIKEYTARGGDEAALVTALEVSADTKDFSSEERVYVGIPVSRELSGEKLEVTALAPVLLRYVKATGKSPGAHYEIQSGALWYYGNGNVTLEPEDAAKILWGYREHRVYDLRKKAGMSQKELAEASGINPRLLRKIEHGETSLANTTVKNAVAIARALGVTVEQLYGDEA